MTEEQIIASFHLTEDVVKCVVGPGRYLQVDAWNPPSSGSSWMPIIANFLNVTMPDQCGSVPRLTKHDLTCEAADVDCTKCTEFVRSQGGNDGVHNLMSES